MVTTYKDKTKRSADFKFNVERVNFLGQDCLFRKD